jgi:hypothetical protein
MLVSKNPKEVSVWAHSPVSCRDVAGLVRDLSWLSPGPGPWLWVMVCHPYITHLGLSQPVGPCRGRDPPFAVISNVYAGIIRLQQTPEPVRGWPSKWRSSAIRTPCRLKVMGLSHIMHVHEFGRAMRVWPIGRAAVPACRAEGHRACLGGVSAHHACTISFLVSSGN